MHTHLHPPTCMQMSLNSWTPTHNHTRALTCELANTHQNPPQNVPLTRYLTNKTSRHRPTSDDEEQHDSSSAHATQQQQKEDLLNVFVAQNTNSDDNVLDKDEMQAAIDTNEKFQAMRYENESTFDTNHDGKIDADEVGALWRWRTFSSPR